MEVKTIQTVSGKYTIVHETALSSILTDIGTFGSITLAFWFNHVFIGSKFLSAMLFICWIAQMSINSIKRTKNYDSSIEFIKDIAKDLKLDVKKVRDDEEAETKQH